MSSSSLHTAGISRRGLLIGAAGAAGLAAFHPSEARAATAAYGQFHGIGSLAGPGAPSEANDINDRGDIVGSTALPGTSVSHAFIMNPKTRGGRLVDLTPSEARSSKALAVNRSGMVAGTLGLGLTPTQSSARAATLTTPPAGSARGSQPLLEPFVWGPRGLEILPLPPGAATAQAVDINDAGTVLVVGTDATGAGLPVNSYLWNPVRRTYTPLPPPAPSATGPVALAHSLDDRGGVVGGLVKEVGPHAWQHTAVWWEPRSLAVHELPTGGANDTYAMHRNLKGLTVGWRITAPGQLNTAIYWPAPDAAPVALPGRVAFDVNDVDQIVGIEDFPASTAFPFRAVRWEPGRRRTTELGDNGLGSYVLAVNAFGRSTGYAVTAGEYGPYNAAGWWDRTRR